MFLPFSSQGLLKPKSPFQVPWKRLTFWAVSADSFHSKILTKNTHSRTLTIMPPPAGCANSRAGVITVIDLISGAHSLYFTICLSMLGYFCCWCLHGPPTSDIDYFIFNLHICNPEACVYIYTWVTSVHSLIQRIFVESAQNWTPEKSGGGTEHRR